VLPFERLRALARYSGDDQELVLEAASCLADFADDPAQLVTVCRRLLAHHPTSGALWWTCAQVLAAGDPAGGAREATDRLTRDRTASRLANVLPFPHDEPIVVLGWPDITGAALTERPDLDVVVVRAGGRLRHPDRRVRVLDAVEASATSPTHLLVEVLAAGSTTAVVPDGTADLRWSLEGTPLWLIVPTGRLLPDRLFAVLRGQIDEDAELVDVGDAAQVLGPWGLDDPSRLGRHVDCPIAPELLRL
jgi:hypothetical protein